MPLAWTTQDSVGLQIGFTKVTPVVSENKQSSYCGSCGCAQVKTLHMFCEGVRVSVRPVVIFIF